MDGTADLAGSARLELVDGVALLDPAPAVFEAMLAGWARQQASRFLRQKATIAPRLTLVRRFADFTGEYPWQWGPAEAEAFVSRLRSGEQPVAVSTARGYVVTLRLLSTPSEI